MRGRGRSVLSFVVACALIGALAPAAGAGHAHAAQQRLRPRLEVRARQPARTSPTRPAPTPTPPTRATTTRRGARVDLPHDWSIELDPTHRPARPATPASSRAASAGTARPSRCRARLAGKSVSLEFDGVYMDSVVYLNGKQVGQPPVRLHRLRGRPRRTRTPTAHAERRRRPGPQQAAQQPLVLGQRHLPQRPPRRHRPGARRAPRHVRHHAGRRRAPSRRASRTCTSRTDVAGGAADADERRHQRPGRPRAHRRRRGAPPSPRRRHRDRATCASSHPHLWSTDDPVPLHARRPRSASAAHVVDRTTHDASACAGSAFDPDAGLLAQRRSTMKLQGVDLHHDQGALGAAVNKDALMRQMKHHEEHGRQRLPHLAQPALAGDDRGLPGARHRDDGRGLRHLAHAQARSTTTAASSTPTATRDIAEMVNAAKNSPAVVLWSIGNEIPDSTSATVGLPIAKRLVADIKAIDTTRPIVIGSDKYRSVPPTGSARRPDPRPARRPRPELQHRRVGRRAARRATPTRSSSSPSRPRRRRRAASTRTPTSSTPARTTRRASARRPPTTTTSPRGR